MPQNNTSMKTDNETEIQSETTASPVVRIDALDENYVDPIREFFALNGCQVFINSSPSAYPIYHLIVGDQIFVKHILDNHKISSQKAMSIVWDADETDVERFHSTYSKYALIDPKPITNNVLEKLCNFFFTGTQKTINLQTVTRQTNPPEKTPKQREPENKKNAGAQQDAERVAHAITQIFTPNEHNKPAGTKPNIPRKKKRIGVYIGLVCFALILPICMYVISLGAMGVIVYRQSLCITKPALPCIKDPKNSMGSWAANARRLLPYIQFPFNLTKQHALVDENLITVFEKISSTITSTVEVETIATDFSRSFVTADLSNGDSTSTVVQVEKLKTQIFSLHTNLDLSYRLIEQLMKQPPFPLSIPSIRTRAEKGITILQIVRTRLQTAERLLLLYPYVAGYKEPLRLLFLFQNSTELRPTGGFIGSVMEVSIQDGVIGSMEVQDVYAIDGQLRGHVDPPDPIRDILAQEHWYLRDSNWNPDFEESAKRVLWFYEKETGKTVQGVVAVNSSLMIQILKALGSIQMPDTKDTITAENFYEKSLSYTQTDFFPGSTQKKDFLGRLVSTVMTSVIGNKTLSGIQTFSIIDEALKNRNIQMYFTDPEAQQLSRQFVWAGNLPSKIRCQNEQMPCIFDYNAIIESNLGVNKANYYVKREDTRDITVQEGGKITETINRTFTNTANGQVGSGVYKNYMRVYVPSDAHITNFTINGIAVPAKPSKKNVAIHYPFGELDMGLPDFSVIAVAFTLAEGEKTSVSLSYEYTNIPTDNEKLLNFSVFSQKQSGIDHIPTIIRIRYPVTWKLTEEEKTTGIALANEGYLEYNSTMSEDADIQIRFIKE